MAITLGVDGFCQPADLALFTGQSALSEVPLDDQEQAIQSGFGVIEARLTAIGIPKPALGYTDDALLRFCLPINARLAAAQILMGLHDTARANLYLNQANQRLDEMADSDNKGFLDFVGRQDSDSDLPYGYFGGAVGAGAGAQQGGGGGSVSPADIYTIVKRILHESSYIDLQANDSAEQITIAIQNLADVALNGDYSSLLNRPTIPNIGANPAGTQTEFLTKLLIGTTIYGIREFTDAEKARLASLTVQRELGFYTDRNQRNGNNLSVGQYDFININSSAHRQIYIAPEAEHVSFLEAHWHVGFQFYVDNALLELASYASDPHKNANDDFQGHYTIVAGSLPGSGATNVEIKTPGLIPYAGDLVIQAFKDYSQSLAGKGGSQGQVWTRGSNDTNAAWADASGGGGGSGLTPEQLAKLNGIEPNAEVNPPRVRRFAATDADTYPASDLQDSEIGLFNGTTQVQSGSIAQANTIYMPKAAATFGQDATQPGTDLSAQDLTDFFGDAIEHGGSVLTALQLGSQIAYVQAETLAEYKDGNDLKGWVLTNLTWANAFNLTGTGYNWQIVAGFVAPIMAATDLVGVVPRDHLPADLVTREQLEGHETDRYASYTNAFAALGDKRGAWCLFNQTTDPTDDTNAIRQPDIEDRSTNGVVAFAAILRTDRDPNHLVWDAADTAADYPNGRELYVSIWNDPSAHVKITLTSAGTLAGTGNAAYIWATATWDEVNDLPDVADHGDYMLIAEREPSALDIELPASDILAPPWLRLSGTELTDGTVQPEDEVVFSDGDTIELTELVEWHDEHHTGSRTLAGYRYVTTNTIPVAGDINYAASPTPPNTGVMYIHPLNDDERGSIKAKVVVGRKIKFYLGVGNEVAAVVNSTPLDLFGKLSFNVINVVVTGTLTNNAAATIPIESAIPARNEIADAAFVANAPNVAGGGGALGRVWAYVSSATNAAWTAASRVLLDSVQATRATIDRGKIFAVKSDDENDLELTQLFDKSETESITNFDTGNQTLTGSTVCQAPDAILMPDIDDDLIEAENISGFGTVYRLKHAASSIRITMKANPSVGVALRIRSVTTKPTASDDANSLGTQLAQNGGQGSQVTVTTTQTNVAADTYFFFQPSAGPRTLTQREVQFDQASYTKLTTETGLVSGGSAGQVLQRTSDNAGVEFAAGGASKLTGPQTVTSSWATVGSAHGNDDILAITIRAARDNDGNNPTSITVIYRFGDIPTGNTWLPIRGATGGERISIRRNSSNLETQYAGSVETTQTTPQIWVFKLS